MPSVSACFKSQVETNFTLYNKDVPMNAKLFRFVTLTVVAAAISTTGCTGGLPWRKKQVAQQMTAEQYAQQAATNIEYNTSDVDFSQDYTPSPQPSASYTSPPKSASSGGGGSCCN